MGVRTEWTVALDSKNKTDIEEKAVEEKAKRLGEPLKKVMGPYQQTL